MKKILVCVAHPDDEILGVGGTICKHIENNDEVYVCVLTHATKKHWSEEYIKNQKRVQKEVDKLIGITKRCNLDLPSIELNTIPHGEINRLVTEVVEKVNPSIIYTHFPYDIHKDHRITFEACLVASRPPKHINLICFETVSETEWSEHCFFPNYWIDITNYIYKKTEAFKIYKSEIRKIPHPRNPNGLFTLAKKRGYDCGYKYAEAFKIIRWYE